MQIKTSFRQRLLDLLVERHHLDRARLEAVLRSPKARTRSVGQLLLDEGLVSQAGFIETLAHGLQLPPITLSKMQLDPALAAIVPERLARRHQVVPVSQMGKSLTVAMADPLNILTLDDLALLTGREITPVIASPQEIEEAIRQLYQPAAKEKPDAETESPPGEAPSGNGAPTDDAVDLSALGMAGRRAPIVQVVDLMIVEALKTRASDIHVEPYEADIRVRYRIDGNLVEAFRLPKRYQNAITTRLKIMAKLDITDNRLPQDGRFKVRLDRREVDFRVSVLPISCGNKVVLRVLDKATLAVGLDQLGLLPESLAAFQKALSRPYGMLLMTGPTGSGKSTTLYSILTQLNEPSRNLLTVEDPVEYQLEGVTQVQVNPEIGLTFSSALRTFLRQAPDVVLVGEIRDGETADIAIKASLTGQIVLSTLHTNDAPSAIARLIDIGVDPFLLASSLIFVAAQRLCRQLCPQCRVPDETVKAADLAAWGVTLPPGTRLYRGKGCPHCRNTGFRGRFAILEAMLIDDGIREMILARHPSDEIKAYAAAHGMRTLRQEGLVHVAAGRTSLAEVVRVTSQE